MGISGENLILKLIMGFLKRQKNSRISKLASRYNELILMMKQMMTIQYSIVQFLNVQVFTLKITEGFSKSFQIGIFLYFIVNNTLMFLNHVFEFE